MHEISAAVNLKNTVRDKIGGRIAEHGGTILEIGAGPGGGFIPYVLKANPNATVIISDLSPTVVREWKRFLDKELNSPEIAYAVFNFCNIPFRDESVDVISDGGGIGNTEQGNKSMALKEVYRVLRPGGLLVTLSQKKRFRQFRKQQGRFYAKSILIYLKICMRILAGCAVAVGTSASVIPVKMMTKMGIGAISIDMRR